ncbi:DUF3772 domain-containing protein [Hyphococcus flavus]|uniref:DUF3772 domain-containing protein n=1 Tax=Hyphococcus flavus TaxID=1866326 RepID=A0AAE9ZCV2_9PROT|nr:DUF3772 domain-containing protein [Hyphococcus flavus]WDI31175.1 DUF3772 domain-containing protein [Hyphococcus flavus]
MALTHSFRIIIFSFLVVLSSFVGALAQSDRSSQIEQASRAVVEVRQAVERDEIEDPDALESRLREIRDGSRSRLSAIERELEANRAQLDLLGPAPGENDPLESDIIAEERSTLESSRAQLNGQRTRVLANIYESGELLTRISGAKVGALYQSLATRGASPLSPSVWGGAWQSASDVAVRIGRYFTNWSGAKQNGGGFTPALAGIIIAIVGSLLMFGPVSRWVTSTFSDQLERRKPTPARRILVAGLRMVARTIPGIIGGLIIIETLRIVGVLTEQGEDAARAFWVSVLAILTVSGFTSGFFSPMSPAWRIAPIDVERGKIVSRLAMAIVIVFSLKTLLVTIGDAAGADAALIRLTQAVASIVIGVLIFLICRSRLWRAEEENKPKGGGWRLVRRFGRALAIIIVFGALAGYVAFADFITTRICFLALIIGVAWLARAMLSEMAFLTRMRLAGEQENKEDAEAASQNFRFWSRLIINTLLAIAVLPVVLILFGVPGETVRDLGGQALFGFNIGGVRIPSVAKLIYAIIVFVIVMAVTRLVQTGVKRGPLAHSRADAGVQNSLITLMGYAGLIVALFLSVSTLGFDLSNLALIAGALSVGIGFGLQSIVNNFVSGLILLFERPIKVGDWIITTSGEGTVKKISVRSTEIETFDRSSIIVPNSELISSSVTNWTHKSKLGRIIVPVGVSYGSDPEKVKEILLKCANDHPKVVSYPEPFVTWMDFGASSLDFEVRAFLRDISEGLGVRTDLRFAIFKALAEAGIEIPFPQRDVHVKSWPNDEKDEKSTDNKEDQDA